MKVICDTQAELVEGDSSRGLYVGFISLSGDIKPRRFDFSVEDPFGQRLTLSIKEGERDIASLSGELTLESFERQIREGARLGVQFLGHQVNQSVRLAKPRAGGGSVSCHCHPVHGLLIDGMKENPDSCATRHLELDYPDDDPVLFSLAAL